MIRDGQRIAVVGAGISGLAAAWLLSRKHEVTLFEAEDRLGGHTHTHKIQRPDGAWTVDTGFIVFNERTYPNLIRLLRRFGIEGQPSTMSFSVRNEMIDFEYKPSSLDTIFAQRTTLFKPAMYKLMSEIMRFRKESPELLAADTPDISLGDYLKRNDYSELFISHFIVPMGAAIWSSSVRVMMNFPARFFVRFFENHGFLNLKDKPQWFTVPGGSSSYIPFLAEPLGDRIHTGTPVRAVERSDDGVMICIDDADPMPFDYAVIATHADQALAMVRNLTEAEADVLRAFPYQPNRVVLHMDDRLMPKRKKVWASWNYHITDNDDEPVAVSYNMNILQSIPSEDPFIVTLNRIRDISNDRILKMLNYDHPMYIEASIPAQARHDAINGTRRTFYCGAYWRNGFHEDGLVSALAVCRRFGLELEDTD